MPGLGGQGLAAFWAVCSPSFFDIWNRLQIVDTVDKCVDKPDFQGVCLGITLGVIGAAFALNKKARTEVRACSAYRLSGGLFGGKAVTAIDRTIVARLERYLGGHSALGAYGFVHFALARPGVAIPTAPASIPAVATAGRFVFKAFFSVEFLLSGRENEVSSAVFAL